MKNNNKGMTLVEIVVAFVLLMIVIVGFAGFFTRSMLWAARSNRDTKGVAMAREYTDASMLSLPTEIQPDSSVDVILNNDADNPVSRYDLTRTATAKITYRGDPVLVEEKTMVMTTITANQNDDSTQTIEYRIFKNPW
ncbi:MAG: type II secretion system GspH family protein [Clostridiales bacterium]|jgi:type II secretory pathway pseudopilin PulG|nr:type II secretion system GspH family protein [Clostridiales bacterium]